MGNKITTMMATEEEREAMTRVKSGKKLHQFSAVTCVPTLIIARRGTKSVKSSFCP